MTRLILLGLGNATRCALVFTKLKPSEKTHQCLDHWYSGGISLTVVVRAGVSGLLSHLPPQQHSRCHHGNLASSVLAVGAAQTSQSPPWCWGRGVTYIMFKRISVLP